MTSKIIKILSVIILCFITTGSTHFEKPVEAKKVTPIPQHLKQEQVRVEQVKKTKEGQEIFRLVNIYSKQYGVDRRLVLALIMTESNFNPKAVSSCGAKGLGQLMPNTFKARNVGNNVMDIEQNIHATTKHYAGLVGRYKGDHQYALAAYNCGGGNIHLGKPIPKYAKAYVNKVQERKILFNEI